MSTPSNERPSESQIKIFKLSNRLKKKLGLRPPASEQPGYIDPAAIEDADRLIGQLCEDCSGTINDLLEEIVGQWKEMAALPHSEERAKLAQEIFITAHEIKDVASLCGYELASYFAESLRDYIVKTDLKLDAQRVIIQAHVDALLVVIKKDIKEDGGPAADKLKEMVKIAVDRYS